MDDEYVGFYSVGDGPKCPTCFAYYTQIHRVTREPNCPRKHLHERIWRIRIETDKIHNPHMDLSDAVWDPERTT